MKYSSNQWYRLHKNITEGYKYHNPQDLVNYLKEGESNLDKMMYKQVKRFVDKVIVLLQIPCSKLRKCKDMQQQM